MASKRRKNKAKFKWTKELIILIVAIVAILTVTIVLSVPSKAAKYTNKLNQAITESNTNNSTSYSLLPTDNVFSDIKHEALLKQVAKNDYVYVLYGSLNSAIVLEQLYQINLVASTEEIKNVYLYSSLWVEETEDTETEAFKTKQNQIESEINQNKDKDVKEFSLLEYPALLVFNNGRLIFNTQEYDDVDQYNWSMYIQKAFYLSKSNE